MRGENKKKTRGIFGFVLEYFGIRLVILGIFDPRGAPAPLMSRADVFRILTLNC